MRKAILIDRRPLFVNFRKIEGAVIEINGQFTEFMSNDYERVPAYVFTLA